MNKILWIMTNSVNNCTKLQNKYAINLLNDEKIIGYGSIEASNYDEFFNTDSCFVIAWFDVIIFGGDVYETTCRYGAAGEVRRGCRTEAFSW